MTESNNGTSTPASHQMLPVLNSALEALESPAGVDKPAVWLPGLRGWTTYGHAHEGLLPLINLAFRHLDGIVCVEGIKKGMKE
jgi:hypothetical protein